MKHEAGNREKVGVGQLALDNTDSWAVIKKAVDLRKKSKDIQGEADALIDSIRLTAPEANNGIRICPPVISSSLLGL